MRRHDVLNSLFVIGQPLLLNIISIPATAYIVRMLGATGYGQWAIGTSIVAFSALLTSLGLRSLYIRDIAQEVERTEERLGEQLGLRGALAGLAGGIAIMVAVTLRYPPIILYCVAFSACSNLLTTFASTLADTLQAFERFKAVTGVNLVAGLVLTIVSVIVAHVGWGAVGLSMAYLAGPAVSCILLFRLVRRMFPIRLLWKPQRNRQLLRQARAVAGQNILTALLERMEQLLIPKLVGIISFGYYSAGMLLTSRLVYIPEGLTFAVYPKLSRMWQENRPNVPPTVTRLLIFTIIVSIPISMLCTLFAHPISIWLFPKKAAVCWEVISITVWSLPLHAMILSMGYALQASEQQSDMAKSAMVATLIGSALSLFLIFRFGILGACWGWVLRQIIMVSLLCPPFVRHFPTVLSSVPFFRIGICTGLMAALLWFAEAYQSAALQSILSRATLAILAYGFALLLCGVVSISDLAKVRHS